MRDWLCARLGVREAFSPPRLTRVVEAFEAQLDAERSANDLDYDESGRLRFSARDLAGEVGDAKGGSQALRITHTRHRRYGSVHIQARTRQIDELLGAHRRLRGRARPAPESLAQYRAHSVWLDDDFAARVEANLAATARGDLRAARSGSSRHARGSNPSRGSRRIPASMPAPVPHDLVGVA